MGQNRYANAYMDGPVCLTVFVRRSSYMCTYAGFDTTRPPTPNGSYPGSFVLPKGKVNSHVKACYPSASDCMLECMDK